MTEEPILLMRSFNMAVLFGWFYNTLNTLTTLNPLIYSNALKTLLKFNWQNLEWPSNTLAKSTVIGPS